MTHDEIQEIVIQTIENEWGMERGENDITCDSTMEQLGLDSLDFIDLVTYMEVDLDIVLSDDELENVNTIGQMVELIKKELK